LTKKHRRGEKATYDASLRTGFGGGKSQKYSRQGKKFMTGFGEVFRGRLNASEERLHAKKNTFHTGLEKKKS